MRELSIVASYIWYCACVAFFIVSIYGLLLGSARHECNAGRAGGCVGGGGGGGGGCGGGGGAPGDGAGRLCGAVPAPLRETVRPTGCAGRWCLLRRSARRRSSRPARSTRPGRDRPCPGGVGASRWGHGSIG
ncbi:hypothetical protein DF268_44940 [Streptomyces sp. V2]|nr:hypothetical protein DF268_44940 [Streptomyces sp. V2]